MSVDASRPVANEFRQPWYRPRMSTYWWLKRPAYFVFVLRELSSVFIAWFVVYLLILVRAVSKGAPEYQDFRDWSDTPWVVGLNIVTLIFVVFHAVTWFNLTPKAMVVKVRRRRVPGAYVAGSAYLGWVVVSAFLAWLLVEL